MADIFIKWVILIAQIILVGLFLGVIKDFSIKLLSSADKYKIKSVSAYIGTPIHEFGHFIFVVLFGFKVKKTQFFPTKIQDNGNGTVTLGYVKWAVTKQRITNSIGMLFVGIGPFISGTIVIVLLTYLLEPDLFYVIKNKIISESLDLKFYEYFYNFIKMTGNVFIKQNLLSIRFVIFIIIISMIAIHMNLSAPDIKVSLIGLAEVSVFVALISVVSYYIPSIYYGANLFFSLINFVSSMVLSLCFICQCLYLLISFIRSQI